MKKYETSIKDREFLKDLIKFDKPVIVLIILLYLIVGIIGILANYLTTCK